jgi:type IV secretion system protein VirD4
LAIFSTSLSRLTRFIDTELEQILCFDSEFTAESFVDNKTAVFFVLPEEDTTKHFLFSLFVMQLYRELLIIADCKSNKKLEKRVMFFEDEFGTLPTIHDVDMTFSASRSRNIFSIPIIQALAQLEKNYGKEKAEIIRDNCQNTLFSGFAPTSGTPEVLSQAMGSYTVLTGSISNNKKDKSVSEQMMSRPLMTADEIKRIPRGEFVILKTGKNPTKTKIPLFKDWGITLSETNNLIENEIKKPVYIDKNKLKQKIMECYKQPNNREPDNTDITDKETKPLNEDNNSKFDI